MGETIQLIVGIFIVLLPIFLLLARRRRPPNEDATNGASTGEAPQARGALTGRPVDQLFESVEESEWQSPIERLQMVHRRRWEQGIEEIDPVVSEQISPQLPSTLAPTDDRSTLAPTDDRAKPSRRHLLRYTARYSPLQRAIVLSEILSPPKSLRFII